MANDFHFRILLTALGGALACLPANALAQTAAVFSDGAASSAQVVDQNPDAKAEQLALSQPKVRANMAELTKQAKEIRDPKMRSEALEILARPRFSVVNERRGHEADIFQKLSDLGLVDKDSAPQPLFPTHQPMRFDAAPASFWVQHHSYPGGLSYHTLTNLKFGLRDAEVWPEEYGTRRPNLDQLRLAVIWHDSAKTMTLGWNSDGTASRSEGGDNLKGGKIAGTGARHIWGVAEAIYRGESPDFIVTLASAHSPPHSGQPMKDLIGYLKAAAIIAGKPYSAAGLSADGNALAKDAPLESYIHHLSDHDSVGAEQSMEIVHKQLTTILNDRARKSGQAFSSWDEDRVLAHYGDMKLYDSYLGDSSPDKTDVLRGMVDSVLSPH